MNSLGAVEKKHLPLRWGHLQLIRQFREPVLETNLMGEFYETGMVKDSVIWVLVCICGREFWMKKSQFPGKRKLRSCGDWTCPYTHRKPRGVPGHPKTYAEGAQVRTVYMPTDMIAALTERARRLGHSFSRVVVELVKKGLGGL